ncbi:serine/threonine-protein kinase [Streptomyces sp. M10(2022)]
MVTLYDSGFHGNTPYFVMQILDGVDLAALVVEAGPFSSETACSVALGMAAALSAAHTAGVLHRDVKPTNVGITRHGSVMVHDFGLARLAGESAITRTGTSMGTPQFMAPEVIMGRGPARRGSLRAGVCMYLMLTGNLPFGTEAEVGAVVERAVGAGVPALSDSALPVAPELAALVDGLCAQNPADRPHEAADVALILEPLVGSGRTVLADLVTAMVRDTAIQQVYRPTGWGARDAGPEYDWDEGAVPGSGPRCSTDSGRSPSASPPGGWSSAA